MNRWGKLLSRGTFPRHFYPGFDEYDISLNDISAAARSCR